MKRHFGFIVVLILLVMSGSFCRNKSNVSGGKNEARASSSSLSEQPQPAIVRGFMIGSSTRQDFDDLRAWGANVVRLQMSPARYATRMDKDFWDAWPSFLDNLEGQVNRAGQAGLKVVLDLHQPPFQNVRNFERTEFWERPDLEETFSRVWTEIAIRMKPYREVIWGYDLLNEPLDRSQLPGVTKQWRPLAEKIVKAIRKEDPDTWIIFEPGPGSLFSGFKELLPLPDPRIIYSAHFYYPQDFTHQGVRNIEGTDLAKAMEKINLQYPGEINGEWWDRKKLEEALKYADEFQAKYKVPVYVGEFSVIRWAPVESATRWLQDVIDLFEARGWSWSYHAFREFHGWSLEHDEKYWMQGMPSPQRVNEVTQRGAIVRKAMQKNAK